MTDTAVEPDMQAPGQPVEPEGVQADYFGFSQTFKHFLPDGVTYFEITSMNEGQKSRFQKLTSQDLILERQSGNARMRMDAAEQRHALIKECVVGWNLTRGGQPLDQPQTQRGKTQLGDFLTLADPRIVEDLEKAIRKANPWLLQDMKVEDIDREIENLQEMRKVAEERERGESN